MVVAPAAAAARRAAAGGAAFKLHASNNHGLFYGEKIFDFHNVYSLLVVIFIQFF
jgi:hypothetical protein